ncbi:MAG: type II/IV secretion system protein [Verrucomicrobia bacterium]|nr:type II/IV secretion system protein [Verrucomicrobiota bacterium]MCH8528615.1 GspE/PulE family protein [Kiritimatiellia bacterium]
MSAPEKDSLRRRAAELRCRFVESVPESWLDQGVLKGMPVDFLRSGPMLPVRVDGEVMLCTPDAGVEVKFPELTVLLGEDVDLILAPEAAVRQAIDRVYARSGGAASEAQGGERGDAARPGGARLDRQEEREDLLRQAGGAPVAARVSRMLLEGLEQGASDIHLEPRGGRMQVRFRLDGVLYPHGDVPLDVADAVVSRIKIMARLDVAERRLPQDGNARVRVGEREIDIRVSVLPVADGERVVLRLLGRESMLLSLSELGMPDRLLKPFREIIRRPHGVIWVTGPTGSGKTTTLYAALSELDTLRRNILTIEDPVEYQLPDIGQVNVQSRIGLTFSAGLRSLLRQDPDVILVGETRDEETAEIVVRASMTGHLVFSTLHANDAVSASLRIIDMGVEPFLVAEATRGALAQRLVRKLCPHCAEERVYQSTGDSDPLKELAGVTVREPVGCERCREGYMGRIGLYELLEVNDDLREAMRQGRSVEQVKRLAKAAGFADMWRDGQEKIAAGLTSVDEVRTVLGAVD